MVNRPTKVEKFWSKVDRTGECWVWTGWKTQARYGALTAFGEKAAHRVAWTIVNGPIPKGMLICHHCDNPPCCRPDHLFLGTHSDNSRDMHAKGRHQLADPFGHKARKTGRQRLLTQLSQRFGLQPSEAKCTLPPSHARLLRRGPKKGSDEWVKALDGAGWGSELAEKDREGVELRQLIDRLDRGWPGTRSNTRNGGG